MNTTLDQTSVFTRAGHLFSQLGRLFNTNKVGVDSVSETGLPDVPSMRIDGYVDVTIRHKMGGSFADGVMYFSSIRPKTTVRSTQTYRVAINFRDNARSETQRLMASRNNDLNVLLRIKGEINWINHQKGPNPILNVDWFKICSG